MMKIVVQQIAAVASATVSAVNTPMTPIKCGRKDKCKRDKQKDFTQKRDEYRDLCFIDSDKRILTGTLKSKDTHAGYKYRHSLFDSFDKHCIFGKDPREKFGEKDHQKY